MAAPPAALFDRALHYADDAFRNFVSLRRSRDLFARLADDDDDSEAAIAAEMATRRRGRQPVIERPFELWYGVIGYPFHNHEWAASRYSDGSFGVWYGSQSVETTVHETVHHFRSELAGRGWDRHDRPIVRERRVARVAVDALVFDLRDKTEELPALVDPESYAFTQDVGRQVHEGRHPGLLAPSARRAGGVNVDIFHPDYLSNPRDVCYLTYRLQPGGEVTVERTPGRAWMRL